MPPHTPRFSSRSPKPATPPERDAHAAAETDREPEKALAGIDDLVETLADLRTEVLLTALNASTRKKGTNMADRTLTAQAALNKVKALPDITTRLKQEDQTAHAEVTDIRGQVTMAQLQAFDDELDALVNPNL